MNRTEKINWLNRYKFALNKVQDLEYTLIADNGISALILSDIRSESGHYCLDDLVIRHQECIQEYMKAYKNYRDIKREVLYILSTIEDPNIYRVMYLRYITLLDWDNVADRMHYSKPYIYKLHSRGLDILDIRG